MSDSPLEDMKSGILEFFNLPMDEKKKFWQVPGILEGFGQAFVVSEQQKLEWADAFYMITLPTYLRKPHLFPKLPQPFSNGIYLSIEHRGTVNALKERISMATFYSPNMDAEIGPAPSLVTPESPALFRRISVVEHLKGFLRRTAWKSIS
ncbi:hypothetical protein CRG98_010559 [Punica granatum]|uniref:Non-haem dioxygenase N-terminal domain-containing protein n=1 Tax=Punica granatum TaxID=22663 RepID=A0A2I0KL92_PUNGR|nr:hypothetical protein CRG98_010559 [Punica granatum]